MPPGKEPCTTRTDNSENLQRMNDEGDHVAFWRGKFEVTQLEHEGAAPRPDVWDASFATVLQPAVFPPTEHARRCSSHALTQAMSHGGTRTPWTRRTRLQREVEQLLGCTVVQAREGMQLRDRVVGEYAALGKVQVVAIADTFADKNPALDACVAGLLGELDVSNARLVAARTLTAELEDMHAKFAVKQTRVDDRSAAGMVQRTRNHDIAAPIARCARLRRGEEQLRATRS
ncbi:hypothetical protein DFH07DRAFT_771601 [Mycena maculata]|uniref:Uncharacterized protein n=1 Tax=Mycena maculata TaxID=230809 RepID=A0AAD7NHI0_9AGAR|nr:hypothetical protein DFH07DRAFT_771601 [Mycena maculata]